LAEVERLRVGMPLDPETTMGPVISEGSMNRILGMIDRAVASRAGLLSAGGKRLGGDLENGYFIAPTVFSDVDPDSEIAQDEVFGPVLCISKFRDEADAVRLANGTRWGLAAFIFTNDLNTAHRVAANLDAGYVSVNGFAGLTPAAPFGGMKDSGYGRQGGRAGLQEFLRPKNVFISLSDS
jgi:aldehyde dehydrogenase (NAD+)